MKPSAEVLYLPRLVPTYLPIVLTPRLGENIELCELEESLVGFILGNQQHELVSVPD